MVVLPSDPRVSRGSADPGGEVRGPKVRIVVGSLGLVGRRTLLLALWRVRPGSSAIYPSIKVRLAFNHPFRANRHGGASSLWAWLREDVVPCLWWSEVLHARQSQARLSRVWWAALLRAWQAHDLLSGVRWIRSLRARQSQAQLSRVRWVRFLRARQAQVAVP